MKEEYQAIAERRVRLGLVLSEVGTLNNIDVSQEDLNRALNAEARRHPGQEQAVVDYYRRTPEAMESLRAPVFEEKVVDFILEMAAITEKKVPLEELTRDVDETPAPKTKSDVAEEGTAEEATAEEATPETGAADRKTSQAGTRAREKET